MQRQRLVRLIRTILKVKIEPRRTRQQYLAALDIAQAQFYRDRKVLSQLGFVFPYSKREKGFMLTEEPVYTIEGLSLGQIMALVLAVREQVMAARDDYVLAYGAYQAISGIVDSLPSKTRKILAKILETTVVREGFGCEKDTLDRLQEAVKTRNRILIDYQEEQAAPLRRHTADPQRLYFNEKTLFLDAFVTEMEKTEAFRVSSIRQIIKTPFLVPG